MDNMLSATFYGLIAGIIGTSAGGIIACFVPLQKPRLNSFILEYSAGLMVAIVCFDLLPNAFSYAPLTAIIIGIVCGVAVMVLSDEIISKSKNNIHTNNNSRNTGLAIAIGVALHNFPEGLAIGSGFAAKPALGISLTIAIMLHDIPEGLSIAIPLRTGGTTRWKALFYTFAAGLPMGLGALLGSWASQMSSILIAICLAVAGGAMIYIVFTDMLPESKRMYGGRMGSLGSILGLISGIIIAVQLKV